MAPYQRSNDTLEVTVIHLFQKAITMTEIAHLIEKMYGHHYTPQTISSMTKAVSEQVKAFNQRPLRTRYVCVYLDATYIAVRRETVSKEAVLLFISDGLKGMVDTISSLFPKARYQTCLVHVARKLSHKVRVEDCQAVCDDFKTVYKTDCLESGREALDAFCLKWQKAYPKMVKSLQTNQHMLTFYSFSKEIWRSNYSTN